MNNSFYNYPFDNEDINMINEIFIKDKNTMNNQFNIREGYLRGNLYDSLYEPYKNYNPIKLIPNNEQADMLLNINDYTFAAHDIRLYLDVKPNDREMIKKYNDYQMKANMIIKEYQDKYGPIMMDSLSDDNVFSWSEYIWPWEMEEN